MRTSDSDIQDVRAETLTAALLYLMTHYVRTGCPRLALCVSRHMQCLAMHPDAARVVREICASLHDSWHEATTGLPRGSAGQVH